MNTKAVARTLRGMINLLSGPERWAKGAPGKTMICEPVGARDPNAVSWCLVGAAHKVAGVKTATETMKYLDRCIPGPLIGQAVYYNDRGATTYEDIHLLLKTALYALEEGEK